MQLLLRYQSRFLLVAIFLALALSHTWFPDTPRRHLLIYVNVVGCILFFLAFCIRTFLPLLGSVIVGLLLICLATILLMFWFAGHILGYTLVVAAMIFLSSAVLEFVFVLTKKKSA